MLPALMLGPRRRLAAMHDAARKLSLQFTHRRCRLVQAATTASRHALLLAALLALTLGLRRRLAAMHGAEFGHGCHAWRS
jgi:hypothetical protein